MRNIRIVIEYDGTDYCGFQDQARDDRPTVQAAIEKAIAQTTGENLRITGAGRTDAGVHALGQVANFTTRTGIPIEKVPVAINNRLPSSIAIRAADVVPPNFHARFWATRKVYRYAWYTRSAPSPFWHRYAHYVPRQLAVAPMQEATSHFVGVHDFAAFRSTNSSAQTTVREMFRATVEQDGPTVFFEVEGTGFLYNMVRIMAGTLLEIGLGRRSPRTVVEALRSGGRELAGQTAPPQGLTLVSVMYDEPFRWSTHDGDNETGTLVSFDDEPNHRQFSDEENP